MSRYCTIIGFQGTGLQAKNKMSFHIDLTDHPIAIRSKGPSREGALEATIDIMANFCGKIFTLLKLVYELAL